jgi:hypothetical protein
MSGLELDAIDTASGQPFSLTVKAIFGFHPSYRSTVLLPTAFRGQITCYLNRTFHMLTTNTNKNTKKILDTIGEMNYKRDSC